MVSFLLLIALIALAAIVLALGALGVAALSHEPADGEGMPERLGVVVFEGLNTLFISRVGGAAAAFLAQDPKRRA